MSDGRRNNGRTPRGLSVSDRFWSKVQKTDSCWLWTASRVQRTGYGAFSDRSKHRVNAHRWAYEALVGPIPRGMQLDHLCRVRHCVNPAHLEVVTPTVNVRRGMSPGAQALRRNSCTMGHSYSRWGTLRSGRRVCRLCRAAYNRHYKAGARLPIDLRAALNAHEAYLIAKLSPFPSQPVPATHHGMPVPTQMDEAS